MTRRALDRWSEHPQLADAPLAVAACTFLLVEVSTPTALMLVLYTAGRWASSRWPVVFLAGTLLPAVVTVARMWAGPVFPAPPDDLFAVSFVTCAASGAPSAAGTTRAATG
ncbi:hypothetical protein [Nonomuraea sp. NPDC002799]